MSRNIAYQSERLACHFSRHRVALEIQDVMEVA